MQILLLPLQSFRVGITKKALQWEVPLLFSAVLRFPFIFAVIHHAGDRVRPSFIFGLTHDIINSATSLMRANLICANRSRHFGGEREGEERRKGERKTRRKKWKKMVWEKARRGSKKKRGRRRSRRKSGGEEKQEEWEKKEKEY